MKTAESGKIILFSAPSGAGKTTIAKHLVANNDNLMFSISATTRPKRENEANGQDYYFISSEQFRAKIAENAFLEYEEVYSDLYYGTYISELHRIWSLGKTAILDVDVKGGLNIKKLFGNQVLSIFVMPPSIDELLERLNKRSSDAQEKIKERIAKAREELIFADQFDQIVVNDVLEQACTEADKITRAFITHS